MNVTTIGLDIAKNVFQVHGVDGHGKVVLRKKLSRGKVLEWFANLPPCLIGIEACPGAHYWARELLKLGHSVKLMPAQYVPGFVPGDFRIVFNYDQILWETGDFNAMWTRAPRAPVSWASAPPGRPDLFVVDGIAVGYANQQDDRLNSFQLILQNLYAVAARPSESLPERTPSAIVVLHDPAPPRKG
jgi:hypothetical protein